MPATTDLQADADVLARFVGFRNPHPVWIRTVAVSSVSRLTATTCGRATRGPTTGIDQMQVVVGQQRVVARATRPRTMLCSGRLASTPTAGR